MNVLRMLKQVVEYVMSGIVRIFKPAEDNYPTSGVQPFEGTRSKRARHRWS